MAGWSVNPTSGSPPYIASAVFVNKESLDGVNYAFEVRTVNTTGSCRVDVLYAPIQVGIATAILSNGFYVSNAGVIAGVCRTWSASIRDLSTGQVIQTENVYVSNL